VYPNWDWVIHGLSHDAHVGAPLRYDKRHVTDEFVSVSKLETMDSRLERPYTPGVESGARHSLRDGPAVMGPADAAGEEGALVVVVGGEVVVVVGGEVVVVVGGVVVVVVAGAVVGGVDTVVAVGVVAPLPSPLGAVGAGAGFAIGVTIEMVDHRLTRPEN